MTSNDKLAGVQETTRLDAANAFTPEQLAASLTAPQFAPIDLDKLSDQTVEQERLTPTQEDREAAAALVIADGSQYHRAKCIRAGSHDEGPLVQAFARHRLAALKSPPIAGGEGVLALLDDGMRTAAKYAREIVRKYDPGRSGLVHNLGRLEAFLDQYPARTCSDCPPDGYPTDATRCTPCPRRPAQPTKPTTSGDVGKLCEEPVMPWHGRQPIPDHAKIWRGRDWVPLDAAISALQFWQERDYQHGTSLAQMEAREQAMREALKPAILRTAAHYLTRHGCRGLAIDVSELADLHDALLAPNAQQWKCRRCGQIVDMAAFKCGCAQSPSPWEPSSPDDNTARALLNPTPTEER